MAGSAPRVDVALAASTHDSGWRAQLKSHISDHEPRLRCLLDVIDPQRLRIEPFHIFVCDTTAAAAYMSTRLVDDLRRRGRITVGVRDTSDELSLVLLSEWGVDHIIELPKTPAEMANSLVGYFETRRLETEFAGADSATATSPQNEPVRTRGSVIAFGGTSGSGVTEVALAAADILHKRRLEVAAVDADDAFPAFAPRLGLDPSRNLRLAVDAVAHRTVPLDTLLQHGPHSDFRVLVGLANARDWRHLRPAEVWDVIDELAHTHQYVIVNVGHQIEQQRLEGGRERYGITRYVLEHADAIVAVATASPVAQARLVDWLSVVDELSGHKRPHVVVNQAFGERYYKSESGAEIGHHYAAASVHFLPYDTAVARAAWDGRLPTRGKFAGALATVCAAIVPVKAEGRPRRLPRTPSRRRDGALEGAT